MNCLPDAVNGLQSSFDLDEQQRKRTVWRFDSGGGSEENFRLLVSNGYQIHAKGISSRRAAALARDVKRWDQHDDIWLGEVKPPFDIGTSFRLFVLRREKKGRYFHSYFVSTLTFSSKKHFWDQYNARGSAEIEQFRQDKSGLALAVRRKRSFTGQMGYVLLTDLVHNLLADFRRHALKDSHFALFGLKRIVRDLLSVPGNLYFDDSGKLTRVELLSQMKFAEDLLDCLERYYFHLLR